MAILEHGETATESRTRGMGTMVRQVCGWYRSSIPGLDGLEFSSLWKAAQGATGILGRHCQRSGGLAASMAVFGGRFGGCLVVPRWWI